MKKGSTRRHNFKELALFFLIAYSFTWVFWITSLAANMEGAN